MQHHAFVIPAGVEEGIERAEAWIKKELKLETKANPDVVVFRYGLFTVEDARTVMQLAFQAPIKSDKKAIVIATGRAYHEAQNALLKLFEEPTEGTYLFLILPSVGSLLPTLRSRVSILEVEGGKSKESISEVAEEFLKAGKEKRSAIIKKLATGKDEDERREHRDEAIQIVNGVEAAAYEAMKGGNNKEISALLSDIAELRSFLQDRAAPVRMILEHISLVLPKGLK